MAEGSVDIFTDAAGVAWEVCKVTGKIIGEVSKAMGPLHGYNMYGY